VLGTALEWRHELRVTEQPQSAVGIGDEDLSAYLDGALDPLRRARVEAAIRADRGLARKVEAYRAQEDGLRQLSAVILDEPVPEHLLAAMRRPPPAARSRGLRARAMWALAASLLHGVALGWLLRTALQTDEESPLDPFIRQAVASHELFLTSEDLDRLRRADVTWLNDAVRSPFKTPIRIPQLLGARYRPVQFRAVEGGGGPALQLAYVSDDGLTSLLIRQHSDRDELLVNVREVDGRAVLYWLDGPLIYALVSDRGADELREMARSVYASTATGGSWQPSDPPLQPATTRP
jgi:anti-sigma factor RsiW